MRESEETTAELLAPLKCAACPVFPGTSVTSVAAASLPLPERSAKALLRPSGESKFQKAAASEGIEEGWGGPMGCVAGGAAGAAAPPESSGLVKPGPPAAT